MSLTTTFNVQHPTFNVQRSIFDVRCSTDNFPRSTRNIQRSTFNVQRSTFNHLRPAKKTPPAPCSLPPATRPPAFTLIEVLIALAIFAMASTYLMTTFVSALTARERSVGNDILHADIQAVRMQLLLEPNLDDAEDGGRYPTLNHGEATWRARIEPTDIIDLFSVELSIDFSEPPQDGPDNHVETLYLLRPTWSEADERSSLLEDKRQALERSRDFRRF